MRLLKLFSWLVLFVTIALLPSCTKIDFQQVETGKPYVGLYQGRNCVVVLDQAEEGIVKGRAYFDESDLYAHKVSFTSDLRKNGKGLLWINQDELRLANVMLKNGRLYGKADGKSFSLSPTQQPEFDFHPEYIEPVYECAPPYEVTFAKHVKGYWASYSPDPELEANGDYGKVFGLKALQLLKTDDDIELKMDLYRPITDSCHASLPLLVLIHGGAFYCGDKQDVGFPEMGRYFAERGYVVASINYRLGFWPWSQSVDRAGYRAVQDANAAIRFILDKKTKYHIDPDNIYVAGSSAGAITALNVALMDETSRPEASRGYAGESFKQNLFSTLEWTEEWKQKLLNWSEKGLDWVIDKLNRVLDGLDWLDFRIPERQGRIIKYLKDLDATKLLEVLDLDYDLGEINSVNPEIDIPFKVKGVVNMWGGIHQLEMLDDHPTDILSFHGDKDIIVPYGYDYPFEGVLDDFSDDILNTISLNNPSIYDLLVTMMPENGRLNRIAFRPMYGSENIDGYARLTHKSRSELHTFVGGGHSLHRTGNVLSPYFNDTILPVMTRFLCEEVVGGKAVRLVQNGSWFEAVDADNVAELHWQVIGGVLVDQPSDNKKRVLLFDDAEEHSVSIGGRYQNGVEFLDVWKGE